MSDSPPLRSLGLLSDLVVMRGLSEVEVHPDRIVLRTPSEPDFWCGNMVIFRDNVVRPETQCAQFRADLPDAAHMVLTWDAPDMIAGPAHEALAAQGFDIEAEDVLTLTGAAPEMRLPAGIILRPILGDADWEQVLALQLEVSREEDYEPVSHEAYLRRRFANLRRQVEAGQGFWLGAFEGERLVGDLGVFIGSGFARFQNVETRASHRRRGICAALVCAGANRARATAPDAIPVIIALAEGAPGRTYRRCGFVRREQQVMAIRPPDGARGEIIRT